VFSSILWRLLSALDSAAPTEDEEDERASAVDAGLLWLEGRVVGGSVMILDEDEARQASLAGRIAARGVLIEILVVVALLILVRIARALARFVDVTIRIALAPSLGSAFSRREGSGSLGSLARSVRR